MTRTSLEFNRVQCLAQSKVELNAVIQGVDVAFIWEQVKQFSESIRKIIELRWLDLLNEFEIAQKINVPKEKVSKILKLVSIALLSFPKYFQRDNLKDWKLKYAYLF